MTAVAPIFIVRVPESQRPQPYKPGIIPRIAHEQRTHNGNDLVRRYGVPPPRSVKAGQRTVGKEIGNKPKRKQR